MMLVRNTIIAGMAVLTAQMLPAQQQPASPAGRNPGGPPPYNGPLENIERLPVPYWTKGDPIATGSDPAEAAWKASRPSGPQGDTWDSIKKLPDWSGAWALDRDSFGKTRQASGSLDPNSPDVAKLQPKWDAYRRHNGAANHGRGPNGGVVNNALTCAPDGMPGMMTTPLVFEFLFTPGRVSINSSNGEMRRVYTDGRSHLPDPDLKFSGESIGHWEGDTLVIDTTAILPKSEIYMGLPQQKGTHVLERIRRLGPDKLEIRTIVYNPKMFREPFVYTRTYDHQKDIEYDLCFENNRDQGDKVDMTPPPPDE